MKIRILDAAVHDLGEHIVITDDAVYVIEDWIRVHSKLNNVYTLLKKPDAKCSITDNNLVVTYNDDTISLKLTPWDDNLYGDSVVYVDKN
jgi:hypothetical protein